MSAGKEKKDAKAARRAHVLPLVERNDFEGLLKMDELTREVKRKRFFLMGTNGQLTSEQRDG